MECPDITNLKLDQDDQKALEEIRRVEQIAQMRIVRGGLSYQQRQFWDAVEQGCGGY